LFGQSCSLAYLADLGCWDDALAEAVTDVELLALEFNHDMDLERSSGRAPRLIQRIIGDDGHLSNALAAGLLREVLRRSPSSCLRQVIQLHLSRECNRRFLAANAAREVLRNHSVRVDLHTASQDRPTPTFLLDHGKTRRLPFRRHQAKGSQRR